MMSISQKDNCVILCFIHNLYLCFHNSRANAGQIKYNNTTVLEHCSTRTLQYNNTTVLKHCSTRTLQYNNTTVLECVGTVYVGSRVVSIRDCQPDGPGTILWLGGLQEVRLLCTHPWFGAQYNRRSSVPREPSLGT